MYRLSCFLGFSDHPQYKHTLKLILLSGEGNRLRDANFPNYTTNPVRRSPVVGALQILISGLTLECFIVIPITPFLTKELVVNIVHDHTTTYRNPLCMHSVLD